MKHVLDVVLKIGCSIYAADFFTGFIHWLEDTFWTEETPLIGKWLIQPNEQHHKKPTAFLEKNWWQSSYDAIIIGIAILGTALIFRHLTWELGLFVLVSISACQVHKYAHIPPGRLPAFIRLLQKFRIIQGCTHHVKHHMRENNTNYCLITPFLNPVLGKLQFWRFLEFILKPVLGEVRK
ncbi:MAG TPA: fatty acid desaturase CarF family protein [Puia sp.]